MFKTIPNTSLMMSLAMMMVFNNCSCDTEAYVRQTPALLVASPDRIDFGDVLLGTADTRTLTLLNEGQYPLEIQSLTVVPASEPFETQSDPFIIEPEQAIEVSVRFIPTETRPFEAKIVVQHSGFNDDVDTITLMGAGILETICTACGGVPTECVDEDTLAVYEHIGGCEEDLCEYSTATLECECGCNTAMGQCAVCEPQDAGVPAMADAGTLCGDGEVEEDEECDDGNENNTDACTNECLHARCGDAYVQLGEECDDGNADNTDACTDVCFLAVCGDGFTQTGEACDDANDVDDDSCTNACTTPTCGDGVIQEGEQCDDGNELNSDACTNTCTVPACGDGFVQGEEECDDGNDVNTDTCTNTCLDAMCGDSFVQPDEECDDGNDVGNDACDNACQVTLCGNEFVDENEECDDGVNQDDTDGCSDTCTILSQGLDCAGIHFMHSDWPTGIYLIDPDDADEHPPIDMFCDMTSDGGGWTLVMRTVLDNFDYDDPLWTTLGVLDEFNFDFTLEGRSKYLSYNQVGFSEIRTSDTIDFGNGYMQVLPEFYGSALELFSGDGFELSNTPVPYWDTVVKNADSQSWGCLTFNSYGVNQEFYLGTESVPGGTECDWNGGTRWGQRVNGNMGEHGDHVGQGWGAYATICDFMSDYEDCENGLYEMSQLLWVRRAICGNARVEGQEECDDGNTLDDDGCSSDCLLPYTSDGGF